MISALGRFLGTLVVWFGVGGFLNGIAFPAMDIDETTSRILAILIIFIGYIVTISILSAKVRNFWRSLAKGFFYFFAGNLRMSNSLDSHTQEFTKFKEIVHTSIVACNIASAVLFLDRMEEVSVVYTHREELEDKCGKMIGGRYLRPMIPVDEEEFCSLAAHWAHSCGVKVQSRCSCEVIYKGNPEDKDILKRNLIVIGSAKNEVTKELQKQMQVANWHTPFIVEGDSIVHQGKRYERSDNEAYGLVTRSPNPFNREFNIALFAGCHREGQKAITLWFGNPDNLHQLYRDYPEKPIQFLLKARYEGKEVKSVQLVRTLEIQIP